MPYGPSSGMPGPYPPPDTFHSPVNLFESGLMPRVSGWPAPSVAQPITGVVSLRELEHPIPIKAQRAAYKAQQFEKATKPAKAIEELEKAIRIYPAYRDAHCNLGVQYARLNRLADAQAEFQKALDIGPPAGPIYANLALTYVASGNLDAAVGYAHKALHIQPDNRIAQRIVSVNVALTRTTSPKTH